VRGVTAASSALTANQPPDQDERMPITGSCACGAVEIEVTAVRPVGLNCYCTICRKVSGAPFTSTVLTAPSQLTVCRGRELLARYNATPEFDRFHCGRCHAPIYGEGPTQPTMAVFVAATLFAPEDLAGVTFDHMFVTRLVPWHQIPDDRPQHPEFPPDAITHLPS
jgi:hypothetical protein